MVDHLLTAPNLLRSMLICILGSLTKQDREKHRLHLFCLPPRSRWMISKCLKFSFFFYKFKHLKWCLSVRKNTLNPKPLKACRARHSRHLICLKIVSFPTTISQIGKCRWSKYLIGKWLKSSAASRCHQIAKNLCTIGGEGLFANSLFTNISSFDWLMPIAKYLTGGLANGWKRRPTAPNCKYFAQFAEKNAAGGECSSNIRIRPKAVSAFATTHPHSSY